MFHYNFYRYVRYMLRRYPKMRQERLGWSSGPGMGPLVGRRLLSRLREIVNRKQK